MNSLWISVARIVRNDTAARRARFHPRPRTPHPQVFPLEPALQADAQPAVFPILGQSARSINYY
jgi:hypothetical protein